MGLREVAVAEEYPLRTLYQKIPETQEALTEQMELDLAQTNQESPSDCR